MISICKLGDFSQGPVPIRDSCLASTKAVPEILLRTDDQAALMLVVEGAQQVLTPVLPDLFDPRDSKVSRRVRSASSAPAPTSARGRRARVGVWVTVFLSLSPESEAQNGIKHTATGIPFDPDPFSRDPFSRLRCEPRRRMAEPVPGSALRGLRVIVPFDLSRYFL